MRFCKYGLIGALLLGACSDGSVLGPAVTPSAALAPPSETVIFAGPHPCDPSEFVVLTGSLNEKFIVDFNEDGSAMIFYHANPQGVSGTGTSGSLYIGNGAVNQRTRLAADGGFSDQIVNTFNIIGQGGAPNFKLHETIRVVFDSNGNLVHLVTNVQTSCN